MRFLSPTFCRFSTTVKVGDFYLNKDKEGTMYEILNKYWHFLSTGLIFTIQGFGFLGGLIIIGGWVILLIGILCAVCEFIKICFCYIL